MLDFLTIPEYWFGLVSGVLLILLALLVFIHAGAAMELRAAQRQADAADPIARTRYPQPSDNPANDAEITDRQIPRARTSRSELHGGPR